MTGRRLRTRRGQHVRIARLVKRSIEIPYETIDVERTARDKGVQCTMKLIRYDNPSGAQWAINGKPIGSGLDMAYIVAATLKAMEVEGGR